jgi:hypothetical protein
LRQFSRICLFSQLNLSTSVPELCRGLEHGVSALLRQESNPRHGVDVLVVTQLVQPDRQVAEVSVPQRLVSSQPLVSPEKYTFKMTFRRRVNPNPQYLKKYLKMPRKIS